MAQPFTLFFFLITTFLQDPASGIYIVNKPPKKMPCENELRMVIGNTKVCISKKPILTIGEVKFVSDIQYDPKSKTHYVDVGLSLAGIQTLNKTVSSLPLTRFAFALDGEVVCLFLIEQEMAIQSIRIGEDAELKDLILVHDVLKKVKF